MASSKEYLDFILEQLSGLEGMQQPGILRERLLCLIQRRCEYSEGPVAVYPEAWERGVPEGTGPASRKV